MFMDYHLLNYLQVIWRKLPVPVQTLLHGSVAAFYGGAAGAIGSLLYQLGNGWLTTGHLCVCYTPECIRHDLAITLSCGVASVRLYFASSPTQIAAAKAAVLGRIKTPPSPPDDKAKGASA